MHYSYTVQFHCPRIPGPSHQFPIYYTSVYVICMVQLCYEFQNILFNIIIHSTTLFNHPRIPKHLINFSSIPLLYGAKSQKNLKNVLVQSKKYIYWHVIVSNSDVTNYNHRSISEREKIMS